mgnify:CR=1 FL=1
MKILWGDLLLFLQLLRRLLQTELKNNITGKSETELKMRLLKDMYKKNYVTRQKISIQAYLLCVMTGSSLLPVSAMP